MTAFNDREKAAENKYAHDQELEFRVHARRSKLIGLWAASKMNISGSAADEYAKSLISATVNAQDDDILVGRVRADLSSRGVAITENDVREELFRLTQVAKDQIQSE